MFFSINSLALLSLTLFCLILIHPISSYTTNQYEILDLQSNNGDLETEASFWTVGGLSGTAKTSDCGGTWLLGGYSITSSSGVYQRTYTSIPAHNMVYFSIDLYIIDFSATSDLFELYFNGYFAQKWNLATVNAMTPVQQCGGAATDYVGVRLQGKVSHNQNTLEFRLIRMQSGSPGTVAIGVRNLTLSLRNQSSSATLCTFTGVTAGSFSCLCPTGFYDIPGTGCDSCNSLCDNCLSNTLYECTSCVAGASFNGNGCYQCDTSCDKCKGTTDTDCTRCPSDTYLYPSGQCLPTCSSPMITRTEGSYKYCDLQCQSTDYIYQNNTCKSTCTDSNFVPTTVSGTNYCNFICSSSSTSFLYWNNTCHEGCVAPLISTTTGAARYCALPCPASQFVFLNGTCSNTCEAPYTQIIDGDYKFCQNPCDLPDATDPSCSTVVSLVTESSIIRAVSDIKSGISYVGGVFRPDNINSVFVVAIAKLIKYIMYINVPLPDRIREGFGSNNSSMFSISTSFTVNMPQNLKDDFPAENLPMPYSLNLTVSSYIYNQWNAITTFVILLALGVLFHILEIQLRKTKLTVLIHVVHRLRILTKWNFFILIFFNSYDDMTFLAILEFQTVTFDSFLSVFSFLLCLTVTISALVFLVLLFKVCRECVRLKRKVADSQSAYTEAAFHKKWESFQVFYAGFKDDSFLKQGCLFFQTLRVIICYFIVAFLSAYPVAQTIQLTIISLIMIFYYLKLKPFRDNFNLLVIMAYEILILIANICIVILAIMNSHGTLSDSTETTLGDIIAVINLLVDIFATIFMWGYVIFAIRLAFKTSRSKGLPGKTIWIYVPIVAYESPGMDFDSDNLDHHHHHHHKEEPVKEKQKPEPVDMEDSQGRYRAVELAPPMLGSMDSDYESIMKMTPTNNQLLGGGPKNFMKNFKLISPTDRESAGREFGFNQNDRYIPDEENKSKAEKQSQKTRISQIAPQSVLKKENTARLSLRRPNALNTGRPIESLFLSSLEVPTISENQGKSSSNDSTDYKTIKTNGRRKSQMSSHPNNTNRESMDTAESPKIHFDNIMKDIEASLGVNSSIEMLPNRKSIIRNRRSIKKASIKEEVQIIFDLQKADLEVLNEFAEPKGNRKSRFAVGSTKNIESSPLNIKENTEGVEINTQSRTSYQELLLKRNSSAVTNQLTNPDRNEIANQVAEVRKFEGK